MQSGNDLEQRQVRVGEPAADQVVGPAGITSEHTLEVVQEFRQSIRDEVSGTLLRLTPLVFVIQARRDRMMGVVRFNDEVGERELELVRP